MTEPKWHESGFPMPNEDRHVTHSLSSFPTVFSVDLSIVCSLSPSAHHQRELDINLDFVAYSLIIYKLQTV